jgi:hypothetical protein
MELGRDLPESLGLDLTMELMVVDAEREAAMPVLRVALAQLLSDRPYEASGDMAPLRFVVDGVICEVPADFCPNCWGQWPLKFGQPECPACGYRLGREVKLLLDSDECPYCGEGKVTASEPVCDECGLELDPSQVVWG